MGRWDWGQIATPAIYILLIAVLAVFGHSALQGTRGLAALRYLLTRSTIQSKGASRDCTSIARRSMSSGRITTKRDALVKRPANHELTHEPVNWQVV